MLLPLAAQAQRGATQTYQTFVYTDASLSEDLKDATSATASRGLGSDLAHSLKGAASGLATGYVTSFVEAGINALGALITRRSRMREAWEQTVKAENSFETTIASVSEMCDFYSTPSPNGPLDPAGMNFDGIGCLRLDEHGDTAFFVACHIDRDRLDRIINHSKFELVIDTFIISPLHSNLPNTPLPIAYSLSERQAFTFEMNLTLTSSWMNEEAQLMKNQRLGDFHLTVPVDAAALDARGFMRYVRPEQGPARLAMTGESFIVPRSYMPQRDAKTGAYTKSWGTGQYNLTLTLSERCECTPEFKKNWSADNKRHKALAKQHASLAEQVWRTVSRQRWDALTSKWVITTLRAPASVLTKAFLDKIGIEQPAATAAAAAQGAQQQGAQQPPRR